jgi:hypothetical protein
VASKAGKLGLYRLDGGTAIDLPRTEPGQSIAGFTATGGAMFVFDRNELPAKVFREDLASGRRELAFLVQPSDRAGLLTGISSLLVTPDGKTYTYSLARQLSELHTVQGLK